MFDSIVYAAHDVLFLDYSHYIQSTTCIATIYHIRYTHSIIFNVDSYYCINEVHLTILYPEALELKQYQTELFLNIRRVNLLLSFFQMFLLIPDILI